MVGKRNRARLFRSLVLIVLLITGSIVAFTFYQGTEVRQTISHLYIERTIDQAVKEFQSYFTPVRKNLSIAQKRGKMNGFSLEHIRSLNTMFIPVLEELLHVSSIIVANAKGEEYFLSHDKENWLTRSIKNPSKDSKVLWQRWDNSGELLEEWRESIDYDPRSRPWFQGAAQLLKPDDIFLTKPYTFFTAKMLGVTAAMQWQMNDKDKTQYVVAFDMLLADIMHRIASLKVSENGKIFVINEHGAIFNFQDNYEIRSDSSAQHKSLFLPVSEVKSSLIQKAINGWGLQSSKINEPFEFTEDGKVWWSGYHPFMVGAGNLWIGVIVPQNDFLGEVSQQRQTLMWISVAIVASGIILIFLIFKIYGKNAGASTRLHIDKNNLAKSVHAAIERGEGSSIEFKSTMRMNLKTGKTGKEIEVAWLKAVVGFLNTEGGVLLIGVDDDGGILGLEADNFDNDDKCRLHFKNLINQHIGLELSKLLFFEIVEVDGKKVVIIDCDVSMEPVFLKNKKEESFYIRSGPSSVQLSVSKVLKYLEHRKHSH